jgi:hypothetical protein
MKRFYYIFIPLAIMLMVSSSAWSSKEDCGDPPNAPAKPAIEANKEDANVQNDYDEVVEEMTGPGVIYLAIINGDQPNPNACGLNPSNPQAEWTGWGGPLNADNMTIGEGAGSRNDIIIGGTLFERGLGTHSIGKLVYPLTGDKYVKFEGYVGLSDEKDPAECGHGGSCDFIFEVDGKEMFKSDVLKGTDAGENVEPVKVEFDIPNGAKELVVTIGDGGDGNGCDHGCVGDAKLLTSKAMAVKPGDKATTIWGAVKASY